MSTEVVNTIINNGYRPLPISPEKKAPLFDNWQEICKTEEGCRRAFKAHPKLTGFGIVCYNIVTTLDFDQHDDAPNGVTVYENIVKDNPGVFDQAIIERTRSGGVHVHLRGTSLPPTYARFDVDGKVIDVEVLRDRRQAVISPTEGYSYLSENTHLNTPAANLPPIPRIFVEAMDRHAREMKAVEADEKTIKRPEDGRPRAPGDELDARDLEVCAEHYFNSYLDGAFVGNRHNRGVSFARVLFGLGISRSDARRWMEDYGRRTEREKREIDNFIGYGESNPDRDVWIPWKAVWAAREKRPEYAKPTLMDAAGQVIEITPEKVKETEAKKQADMEAMQARIKEHDEKLKQEKAEAIKAQAERELNQAPVKAKDEPKWTLLGIDDIMKERPPRTWNIQGMIPALAVVLIVGIGGIGKTYFVLYAAACLAAGRPMFPDGDGDSIPVRKTRVLFVCAEMNEDEIARRLKAILRGLELAEEEKAAFKENFKFVALPEPPLRLDDAKSLNVLGRAVSEHRAEVAIIDHLNAVKGIAKENSDEMGGLMQSLREYIGGALKCSPWIVHHQRKVRGENGDEAAESRGHSSIKDNSDVVLQLTRKEGGPTKYAITKTKYGDGKAVYGVINFQNDEAGDIIAVRFSMADNKTRVTNKGAEQAIYDTLNREGELPKGELVKLVQGRLENSGCSSGDKFLGALIDDMEKARKLTFRWGGKTHRTCYVSWYE